MDFIFQFQTCTQLITCMFPFIFISFSSLLLIPITPKESPHYLHILKSSEIFLDISATITRYVILHTNFLQIETFYHIMEGTSYGLETNQNFQGFKRQ